MNLSEKAREIRAVILDVDGVLTDGRIGYSGSSEEIKFFNAKDGHALKLLRRAGITVGLLSGRTAEANRRRAEELGLDFVYQGEKDKDAAFTRLLQEHGLQESECLYVGDDVVDIPVLRRAGIGVVVGDAVEEVVAYADWQTSADGGHGAVREVAVWLLKQTGQWDKLMARYVT